MVGIPYYSLFFCVFMQRCWVYDDIFLWMIFPLYPTTRIQTWNSLNKFSISMDASKIDTMWAMFLLHQYTVRMCQLVGQHIMGHPFFKVCFICFLLQTKTMRDISFHGKRETQTTHATKANMADHVKQPHKWDKHPRVTPQPREGKCFGFGIRFCLSCSFTKMATHCKNTFALASKWE